MSALVSWVIVGHSSRANILVVPREHVGRSGDERTD